MAKWPYSTRAWQTVRTKVLIRDGHRCQLRYPGCLGTATAADHVIPLQDLDRTDPAVFDPANLQAACVPCNTRKRNDNAQARSRRRRLAASHRSGRTRTPPPDLSAVRTSRAW